MNESSIFSSIQWHAELRPHDVAVIHKLGSATYSELRSLLVSVSEALEPHGILRGQTCAVYVQDPWWHFLTTFALMLKGVRTISAHETFEPLPAALPVDVSVVDKAADLDKIHGRIVTVRAEDFKVPSAARVFGTAVGFENPHDICRWFGSSGTTGTPKAIGHSSVNLMRAVVDRMSREAAFLAAGPCMSLMGMPSIGGFTTAMAALWAGVPLVIPPDVRWALRAINLYGIKTLLASPVHLQTLVSHLQGRGTRFPSLARVYTGGSSLPTPIALGTRVLLCPNISNSYGATEICGAAAIANGALLAKNPNAAGKIMPGVSVRITDDAGNDMPSGHEGVVRLRTPVMCDGYMGDAQATTECFRDGWFLPGDLGTLSSDGILTITGRTNELINLGGVKVNPREIDDFLIQQGNIRDAAAFAVDGPLGTKVMWAAVVADATVALDILLERCKTHFAHKAPTKLVRVAQIPRNAMGKAMRRELTQAHNER